MRQNICLKLAYTSKLTLYKQIPPQLKQWIDDQKVQIKKYKIVKDIGTFSLEEAISKVIKNKDIDTHLKIETLKQFKIIELTNEQEQYRDQIANIVLDKSPDSILTVLEKKIEQNDEHFFQHSYKYLVGEKKFNLDMQEGYCKFSVDVTKVFINNNFQEERERLLNTITQNDNVVNLFGDIILDIRLFKERNANVSSCVASQELLECFQNTKTQNSQQQKSASRSLSQSSNTSRVQIKNGTLNVECQDIFTFLEDQFKKQHSQFFIVSRVLKDLSFISSFVGIRQNSQNSSVNGDDENHQNNTSLIFYYLLNEEDYKNKSLSELIIDELNHKVKDISGNTITSNIFEKSDLGSIAEINFGIPNKKLIGVNMKIKNEILNNSVSLLNQVREQYKNTIRQNNKSINATQNISVIIFNSLFQINQLFFINLKEYESDLQKKVKKV